MIKVVILLVISALLILGCNSAALDTVATPSPSARAEPVLIQATEAAPTLAATEAVVTPRITDDIALVAYGEVKEGRLDSPAATALWAFEAQAGEHVNIVLNSQFDSYLELYGPDGELIASNDDAGSTLNAALFDVLIKRSGLYRLAIRGYDNATGSYALALTGGHPTTGSGTLTNGDSRAVVLSQEGAKWHYQGRQNDYLSLTVETNDPAVDPFLSLFGPDGTLLVSDDDSHGQLNPAITEFQLPEDGRYVIRAHTISGTGLVTLTLTGRSRPSGGGPIAMGQSQNATLPPGQEHRWQFSGQVGQIVSLKLTTKDFEPFLELRNSQNTILAESGSFPGSTESTINLFALPADDTYTIITWGASATAGGDYSLSLKVTKIPPGGGPLLPDTLTQATLLPGQADTWTFEAQAGSFVTVQVRAGSFDSYVELYNPAGDLLSQDDDSGGGLNAAILDFPISENGEYELIVKSNQADGAGGVYELQLTLASELAIKGALTGGDSHRLKLAAGEQHAWLIEAVENNFLTIRTESDTLDTYLSLYNSQGTLLAVNDDFIQKQAAIVNFIVPAAGEYRVVARAYSSEEAGQYTISLEITDEALPIRAEP